MERPGIQLTIRLGRVQTVAAASFLILSGNVPKRKAFPKAFCLPGWDVYTEDLCTIWNILIMN